MTTPTEPTPGDVVSAALTLHELTSIPDNSPRWSNIAEPTKWTAAHTIEHIADALLFYSGQVARRADAKLPVLRDGRDAPASEHLDNVLSAAHVLAALLRDLAEERAFHPSGTADVPGWAGMAVTEILVHGTDAARAIGVRLDLPENVCARTVSRVFPWIDPSLARPSEILLAVTGRISVEGVHSDPDWWWQSAPLNEWDGLPARRDVKPGWT
ncbi:maleylpyruvate isomerase N-terminal domain-containing protein [Rhodococcus sp. NPDC057135]|uniref:maleylpyruvate isomerase N-terminal domain-containing protein n=1 Tax=Rhodococcus sp. NPDC057135 TaxID=3346028 RepID=UPI00362529AF